MDITHIFIVFSTRYCCKMFHACYGNSMERDPHLNIKKTFKHMSTMFTVLFVPICHQAFEAALLSMEATDAAEVLSERQCLAW